MISKIYSPSIILSISYGWDLFFSCSATFLVQSALNLSTWSSYDIFGDGYWIICVNKKEHNERKSLRWLVDASKFWWYSYVDDVKLVTSFWCWCPTLRNQNCYQHILFPTSVTNINVAVDGILPKWSKRIKVRVPFILLLKRPMSAFETSNECIWNVRFHGAVGVIFLLNIPFRPRNMPTLEAHYYPVPSWVNQHLQKTAPSLSKCKISFIFFILRRKKQVYI